MTELRANERAFLAFVIPGLYPKRKQRGPKNHPCKIGTIPALVVLKGSSTPLVGCRLIFRDRAHRSPWQVGLVTQTTPDGFFFMDLV